MAAHARYQPTEAVSLVTELNGELQMALIVEGCNGDKLSSYEERGFRIEGAGRISDGGPNYWVMIKVGRQ